MKTRCVVLFAASAVVLFAPVPLAHTQAPANMRVASAFPGSGPSSVFYVTIKGARQGVFKGSSTNAAHRDQIVGIRFSVQVSSPRDSATGQASGRHNYSVLLITKEWDAASPQLFTALATSEALQSVDLEFVRAAPDGREYVFETIRLSQAAVNSVRQYIGVPSAGDPADARALEDVSFSYRKIEIVNTEGKTTFSDENVQ